MWNDMQYATSGENNSCQSTLALFVCFQKLVAQGNGPHPLITPIKYDWNNGHY